MARYIRTDAFAEAVQFSADTIEQVEAAARLGGEPAPDGRYFQRADGVSPMRGLAIWNQRKRTWDHANPGDWVVVDRGGCRVLKADAFAREYERVPR